MKDYELKQTRGNGLHEARPAMLFVFAVLVIGSSSLLPNHWLSGDVKRDTQHEVFSDKQIPGSRYLKAPSRF